MKDWINKIHCGDSLKILKEMPDNLVDMVMTSPPYWGLRDYGSAPQVWDGDENCKHEWGEKIEKRLRTSVGPNATVGNNIKEAQPRNLQQGNFCQKCGAWRGELGLEPDFNLYIKHLCDIFDEIKRVLKDTGVIFVNIGDTHNGSGGAGNQYSEYRKRHTQFGKPATDGQSLPTNMKNYPTKSLCGIPARFEIEMKDNRGWIHRNTVIWYKKNCMPSSANDRFTIDFEYVFFFTKSNKTQYWTNEKTFELVSKQPLGTKGSEGKDWEWREINSKKKKVSLWTGHDYYFEQQFEELKESTVERVRYGWHGTTTSGIGRNEPKPTDKMGERWGNKETGRNKRCVWDIPPTSFSEAHFAVYPEGLCITPIKAGCPEFVCKKCGKPREKIFDTKTLERYELSKNDHRYIPSRYEKKYTQGMRYAEVSFIGYSDCGCNARFKPGVALDPFSGAGTTCLTAKKLNRQYIGIELKPGYANMSEKRIHNEAGLL